jgi:transposase
MPPDPRDWLPEGHLAWFVLESVEQMDLAVFYGSYRVDGWGRAAFEPSMMVSLLFYAYARGERSSRGIERRYVEDVAYRVIAAQQKPDHATIARFRARHEDALAGLFGSVLGLCKQAGLVKVGVIAIDGTKVHANASHHSNLDYEQLAREILKEAGELDGAEDELYGDARGDECPSTCGPARDAVLLCDGHDAGVPRSPDRSSSRDHRIPALTVCPRETCADAL